MRMCIHISYIYNINKTGSARYGMVVIEYLRRSTGREAMLAAAVRATIARLRFSRCLSASVLPAASYAYFPLPFFLKRKISRRGTAKR